MRPSQELQALSSQLRGLRLAPRTLCNSCVAAVARPVASQESHSVRPALGYVALVTDGVQVDCVKSNPHLCNYFGISQQVRKIIGQYTDKLGI